MKFKIPVKPHVKDFYTQNPEIFGEKGNVRKNSLIGLWVMTVFAHPPIGTLEDYAFLELEEILDHEDQQVELVLNLSFEISTRFITDERVVLLGCILETLMEFFAIGFIRGRMDVMPSENAAASAFMRTHSINDGHCTPHKFRMMHRRLIERSKRRKSVQKVA